MPIIDDSGEIVQGTLECTDPACGACYPVIDGVAILVVEPVRYLEAYRHQVVCRRDLDPVVQSFIDRSYAFSDIGPAGQRYLSQYSMAHYGPAPDGGTPGANGMDGLVEAAAGGGTLVLDLGCATGRWTLVAAQEARFVLGLDLDFGMVRAAREMRATGAFDYPQWRGGREFAAGRVTAPELVSRRADFVVADVMCPPVGDGEADILLALNLTDNVPEPARLIESLGKLLRTGGRFLHSTPYRWNTAVTSPEKQLDPAGLRTALAAAGLEVVGDGASIRWFLPGVPGEVYELEVEVLAGVRC